MDREDFLHNFEQIRGRTMRLVRCIPADKIEWTCRSGDRRLHGTHALGINGDFQRHDPTRLREERHVSRRPSHHCLEIAALDARTRSSSPRPNLRLSRNPGRSGPIALHAERTPVGSALFLADRQGGGFSKDITNLVEPTSASQRIFTARAASSATTVNEISDCNIIPALAQRESTAVSVGEKAVLVLNARNR
jgi:hypothetical protein